MAVGILRSHGDYRRRRHNLGDEFFVGRIFAAMVSYFQNVDAQFRIDIDDFLLPLRWLGANENDGESSPFREVKQCSANT